MQPAPGTPIAVLDAVDRPARRASRMLPLAGLGAAVLLLAGCSSPAAESTPVASAVAPTTSTAPDASATGSATAPVVVDLDDANGTTITVAAGGTVDLDTDDEADWSASIADPSLAEFIPGTDGSGVETNPGLRALAAGTTQVTITELPDTDDGDDGDDDGSLDVVQFTLVVTG